MCSSCHISFSYLFYLCSVSFFLSFSPIPCFMASLCFISSAYLLPLFPRLVPSLLLLPCHGFISSLLSPFLISLSNFLSFLSLFDLLSLSPILFLPYRLHILPFLSSSFSPFFLYSPFLASPLFTLVLCILLFPCLLFSPLISPLTLFYPVFSPLFPLPLLLISSPNLFFSVSSFSPLVSSSLSLSQSSPNSS